jgi:hypothetical protein
MASWTDTVSKVTTEAMDMRFSQWVAQRRTMSPPIHPSWTPRRGIEAVAGVGMGDVGFIRSHEVGLPGREGRVDASKYDFLSQLAGHGEGIANQLTLIRAVMEQMANGLMELRAELTHEREARQVLETEVATLRAELADRKPVESTEDLLGAPEVVPTPSIEPPAELASLFAPDTSVDEALALQLATEEPDTSVDEALARQLATVEPETRVEPASTPTPRPSGRPVIRILPPRRTVEPETRVEPASTTRPRPSGRPVIRISPPRRTADPETRVEPVSTATRETSLRPSLSFFTCTPGNGRRTELHTARPQDWN